MSVTIPATSMINSAGTAPTLAILTESGSTYIVFNDGTSISRVSKHSMVDPDGFLLDTDITGEDFCRASGFVIGEPLAGLVGKDRTPLTTTKIVSITPTTTP